LGTVTCPHCREQVPDKKFCVSCGRPLVATRPVEHPSKETGRFGVRRPRTLILFIVIALVIATTPALINYLGSGGYPSNPPTNSPQRTTQVLMYSLSDTFAGQPPTDLAGHDIHAEIYVTYFLEGQYQAYHAITPIVLNRVDVSSQISFTVDAGPGSPSVGEGGCLWGTLGQTGYTQIRFVCGSLHLQVGSNAMQVVAFFHQ
jgi:hypothetical protein